MRGNEKAKSANKINSVLRDYVKGSSFIRNFKRNIARKKWWQCCKSTVLSRFSHTPHLHSIWNSVLSFSFFFSITWSFTWILTTLVNVKVSYKFLKSLKYIPKNVPQLSILVILQQRYNMIYMCTYVRVFWWSHETIFPLTHQHPINCIPFSDLFVL